MEVAYRDIVAEFNIFGMFCQPDFLVLVNTVDVAIGSQYSQVVWVKFPDSGLFH